MDGDSARKPVGEPDSPGPLPGDASAFPPVARPPEPAAGIRFHPLRHPFATNPALEGTLHDILAYAAALFGAAAGVLLLCDPTTEALYPAASLAVDDAYLDEVVARLAASGGSRCAAGLPLALVSDAEADPRLAPFRELAARAGHPWITVAPLRARNGDVLGLLLLHFSEPRTELHPREVFPLSVRLAGVALENTLLRERAERQTAERLLAEEGLRSARDAAEAASRAKSQFLATISHEFRTPLTAVIGFADLLESGATGPVTPRQRDQIEHIRRAAWHLVEMIDEILTFARMEAGRELLQLWNVDVVRLCREVGALMEGEATRKGLTLRVTAPDSALFIETDAGKLRQILINLLGNALKFTEQGEVELALEIRVGSVQFQVRDSGIGIAPEDRERIFEAFVQADQGPSRGYAGTGLGLAVSRKLAQMLGGDISLQSESGRGSTFTVDLPLMRPRRPRGGAEGSS